MAGILKSFAIETMRIFYDVHFCYFDGTMRIDDNFVRFHKESETISMLESKRCTPDSRLYLRDTLLSSGIRGYQRYEGVNINLVELNVDDVEGSLPSRVKS